MADSVYTYSHDGVFAMKVSGRNAGRYEKYCARIGAEINSEQSYVEEVTPLGKERRLPSFYETRYFVRCDFKIPVRDAFINHKMASVADAFDFDGSTLVGTFDFVNSPGKFCFEIVWYQGAERHCAAFEWMVVSEKLDVQKDYRDIVDTIEKNAPGLVRAFLAKSKGQAGLIRRGDTNDAIWADIFGALADRYRRACEWVTNRPHLKYVSEVEYRRAGLVKRWTPSLVNRYCSMSTGKRDLALYRTEHISPQVDTVENRFVKHTLKMIRGRLDAFARECRKHSTVSENFIKDLERRSAELGKIARKPFFTGVGRFTGFRQESMALQRKQGYAEIYATWVMLQKTLDTTKTGFTTGHRPISALYEFWCFLRIADILEQHFGYSTPSGKVEGANVYGDLFEETDSSKIDSQSLSALTYEYPAKDGASIKLLYQQNYGKENADGHLAYYNPQRPDIVLVIERGGETFTYLFDAKYRIEDREGKDASPAEPINDMHRYRDAILYRTQDGDKKLSRQIVGAYVLYPGRPLPRSYDYRELIQNENIGAIPLLPGEEGGKALVSFIGGILGKQTAYEHLSGDIPTLGTSVVVGKAFGEGDILDVEVAGNEWDKFVSPSVKSIELTPEQLKGREPKNVKLVRIITPNHPQTIYKVQFHSMQVQPTVGPSTFNVEVKVVT